jgi:uncharacterized protein
MLSLTRRLRAALTVFFILLLAVDAPQGALAQDGWGDFFGGLFSSGGQRARAPARMSRAHGPRVRRMAPYQERRATTHWRAPTKQRKARAVPDADSAPAAQEPEVEVAFRALVIGDALATMLANGLDEAFDSRPEIEFVSKGKENSGLVRSDYYDWPKTARELLASGEKIDAVAIVIGTNDKQTISDGAQSFEPMTPGWRERYVARVDSLLAAFKEKGVPIVWIGLPIMKPEQYSADMGRLNEIYKERVAKAGAAFIDIWEPFADERGLYNAYGPDVNGQTVKLRTADGIHLTDAGARKMAHFVEGEITRLFEARRPAAEAPPVAETPAPAPAPVAAPIVIPSPVRAPNVAAPTLPERPAIGATQTLTGAPVLADELAKRGARPVAGETGAAARAVANHLFVEGRGRPARAGRIDDFSWRGGAGGGGAPELATPNAR